MAEENSGVTLYQFNPIRIINEVKKRPALYRLECNVDRDEKLSLWKEIGSALFHDWDSCNKAQKYDRVLQLQKKWRSLRDAYNRELRCRRSGVRVNRRVYRYFKRLSFLGGFEGTISGSDNDEIDDEEDSQVENAVIIKKEKATKKRKVREESRESTPPAEEFEMPIFPIDVTNDNEADGDKLFLLSFLPELRQLPSHIKMWARAQIANVMQEAVSCHFNKTMPGTSGAMNRYSGIKTRNDNSD